MLSCGEWSSGEIGKPSTRCLAPESHEMRRETSRERKQKGDAATQAGKDVSGRRKQSAKKVINKIRGTAGTDPTVQKTSLAPGTVQVLAVTFLGGQPVLKAICTNHSG